MPCRRRGARCSWRGAKAPPIASTFGCAAKARRRSSMTEIQDLLSYKLHRVANLLSRGAELRYRREFGVSLLEWRTLALLGAAEEPMSLVQLAMAAGVDKGQLSRVATGRARRRLARRAAHPGGARAVRLTVSTSGTR